MRACVRACVGGWVAGWLNALVVVVVTVLAFVFVAVLFVFFRRICCYPHPPSSFQLRFPAYHCNCLRVRCFHSQRRCYVLLLIFSSSSSSSSSSFLSPLVSCVSHFRLDIIVFLEQLVKPKRSADVCFSCFQLCTSSSMSSFLFVLHFINYVLQ